MPWLVAGIVVLAGLLYMAYRAKDAEPTQLARGVRIAGIGALGIATVALALTGRVGLAFVTGAGAAALWRNVFYPKPQLDPPPGGGTGSAQEQARRATKPGTMTREEALSILGLEENASEEEIKAAHRRLISQMHPDKGGSDWLAARLNEAKDALLVD